MADKPILFTGEMVRAILEGRKSQTRRVIVPQVADSAWNKKLGNASIFNPRKELLRFCPYGQPGDRLWVRETWRCEELDGSGLDGVRYRADDAFVEIENTRDAAEAWVDAYCEGDPWRPSIFMRRWMSRIMLEVVNVRVERVQEITEADAVAEGVTLKAGWNPIADYADLWNKINYKRGFGWFENPWVWVIEFTVLEVHHG
jgi:hypothetical protein